MNDKLKRLALKMMDLFPSEIKTPQECYELFEPIYKSQNDYFSFFPGESIVKLVLYIYSYNTTQDFKLADKTLNNLAFISIFTTTGNYHDEECPACGGNGTERCDTCYGHGEVNCEYCDGDGTEDDGSSCGGCGGNGTEVCGDCGGDGQTNCYECDGTGEVDTEKLELNYYYICTWDKYIKDRCELEEGKLEPAMSEYDFDRLRDEYIILRYDERYYEVTSRIEINQMYCVTYSDEPKLKTSYGKYLAIHWEDNDEFDKYKAY
jgi:hypothetical protein